MRSRNRLIFQHLVKDCPVNAQPLTAAIEPFVHDSYRLPVETPEPPAVIAHAVIIEMTLKLLLQLDKQFPRAEPAAFRFDPVLQRGQCRAKLFRRCPHPDQRFAFAAFAPIILET